ncbi:hypothetical protein SAMN05216412_102475 [Nitrosospira multiformis]|uniref:Uncharacterized protein n=1 Tax=Nitrosospira multiformis TaxID=1231 RepID=A0A1I0B130_9PROT|nr:hypothetical protein [Nitrosospira multiformis]SET00420.1 hypothetical protein SAMN05216412_102475 [Nitrosospira multiformis]
MKTSHILPVLLMLAMSFTPAVQAKKGQDRADEFLHVQAFAPAAPAAEGKVSHLLINPFGEVDGLLLDTGTSSLFRSIWASSSQPHSSPVIPSRSRVI